MAGGLVALASFRSFSFTHLLTVLVFAATTAAVILLARQVRDRRRLARYESRAAVLQLAAWGVINGYWLLPGRFDPAISLPLHICDLAALAAPAVLLTHHRWLRAILYFWGLGLSTQGFITPDLQDGPASLGFYMFWGNHYIVVGTALYDLIVSRYRPGWKDFRIAFIGGLLYVALVIPLNMMLDLNYGYLGRTQPGQPTIIQLLGPWPWRMAVIAALVAMLFVVMTIPWTIRRKRPDPSHQLA